MSNNDAAPLVAQLRDALAGLSPKDWTLAVLAAPPTNQCGETCERAKLCSICARGLGPESAQRVGDTKFEGWLSCHEPDRNQNRTVRYSKQDMRDAYWAGYCESKGVV